MEGTDRFGRCCCCSGQRGTEVMVVVPCNAGVDIGERALITVSSVDIASLCSKATIGLVLNVGHCKVSMVTTVKHRVVSFFEMGKNRPTLFEAKLYILKFFPLYLFTLHTFGKSHIRASLMSMKEISTE